MNLDLLRELIRIFEESDLNEIEVEEDGHRMRLHKAPPVAAPQAVVAPALVAPDSVNSPAASAVENAEPETDDLSKYSTIDSPMVGTFYAASAPGEGSFIEVGDRVEENATVCIVEAMKLMNEITAKYDCVIEKVLVENGEPVEFGQSLFAVSPL